MTDEEVPEGRTFGKGELDSENTLATLRARIERIQEAGADDQAGLHRRMASAEEEMLKALERINVLRNELDAATARIAKLEERLVRPDPFASEGDPVQPWEIWNERQIEKLAANSQELLNRVKRLESQTQFETSEDDARLKELERRVRVLNQQSPALDEVWTREQINAELVKGKGRFLPGLSAVEIENTRRALEVATDRVRAWASTRTVLSQALIEEICTVIQGGVVHPPRLSKPRIPFGSLPGDLRYVDYQTITDHSFRHNGQDRRHCSYARNREENLCGGLESQHGIQGRPIKDQPQA